jgi:hypothetical protein
VSKPELEIVKESKPPARRSRTKRPVKQSRWPTNKWWAASITAFLAAATFWINEGNSKAVAVAWLTFGGQALVSYMVPNHQNPGGLATKE